MVVARPSICIACAADVASFLHVSACGTGYETRSRAIDQRGIAPLGEAKLSASDLDYYKSTLEQVRP